MPTETKKQQSKHGDHEKQKNSRDGQTNQGDIEKSDRGDNQFHPSSGHRGEQEIAGQKADKGQRPGPQGNRAHKSEPEEGVRPERGQDQADGDSDKV